MSPGIEFCSCRTILHRSIAAASTTEALAYPPEPKTTEGLNRISSDSAWNSPTVTVASVSNVPSGPLPRTPREETCDA